MKIAKPELHGHSVRRGKIWIISSLINGVLGGILVYHFYINRRKKIYNDFYESYDIDKEFETMRSKGLFDSC